MSVRRRIQNLSKNNNKFVTIVVKLMRELKWSYDDVMNLPLPSFIVISEELSKQIKKENEEAKRKR